MRRMIMMSLCLLWDIGDAQAREYVWIKHRLLITHEFYNQIIYTRDITLWVRIFIQADHPITLFFKQVVVFFTI